MLKTYIRFPDGREISSGAQGEDAILSVTVTQCVNSGQELTLGSVCSNMLEASILCNSPDFSIAAGDVLTVYRQEDSGPIEKVGTFIAEKPTRSGGRILKLTAYDAVSLLDKDITRELQKEERWPMALQHVAEEACSLCGLISDFGELPFWGLSVSGISGEGITARQVLGWVSELTGYFCRATADGKIEFAWYGENDLYKLGITPEGGVTLQGGMLSGIPASYKSGALTLACPANEVREAILSLQIPQVKKTLGYYSGSLSLEDYTVAPVQKVWLKKTDKDTGIVYPDGMEEEANTYILEGNPILSVLEKSDITAIAKHLYERLKDLSYTPCRVSIPANLGVSPGDILEVTDKMGKTAKVLVMTKTQAGQKDTIECTGSHRRDSSTAVNNRSYTDLKGKVLSLQMDMDGLKLENSDNSGKITQLQLDVDGLQLENHNKDGKLAKLQLDVEGIHTQVEKQNQVSERVSKVEQTAESVKISVESLEKNGVAKIKTGMGYTFDDTGLNIHKSDSEITNTLNETGMQVVRNAGAGNETLMLRADATGVVATDVKVRNFLVISDRVRFEEFGTGRIACFWIN